MNRAQKRASKRTIKSTGYRTPKEIIEDEMTKLQYYYAMLEKMKEKEGK